MGLWHDGENPLFYQKLAANSSDSDASHTYSIISDSKKETCKANVEGDEYADSPKLKKQKLLDLPEAEDEPVSEHSHYTRFDCSGLSDKTAGKRIDKDEKCANHLQHGFNSLRWLPDPDCENCRLKYIDPKPQDLRLYLHALRYKVCSRALSATYIIGIYQIMHCLSYMGL